MKRRSKTLLLSVLFNLVFGLVSDQAFADILYVSNAKSLNGAITIEKITSDGAGSLFANVNALGTPSGLAFDNAGKLSSIDNNKVYKYTAGGSSSLFGSYGFYSGNGCAYDTAGNLYMASPITSQIIKFAPNGVGSVFANTGSGQPFGLAFDSFGNLYAACVGNDSIEKFTPDGVGSTFASGGLVSAPYGLAFDNAGNLYEANQGGGINKFTPSGAGSLFASIGLNIPEGLAFDSSGNLYVANNGNNTIEKFTPDGVGSVFARGGLLSGPTYLSFTDDYGVPLTLPIEPAPEPTTLALFTSGLLLLLWKRISI
jgi:hypothetical protein